MDREVIEHKLESMRRCLQWAPATRGDPRTQHNSLRRDDFPQGRNRKRAR